MATANVKYHSKRGFHYDPIARTMDIYLDGERMGGFASFETLYAAPTAATTAVIGQQVQDPMGGLWRYGYFGAAITNPLLAAAGYKQPTDLTPGATTVGSYTIACTGSGDASCTADQYANSTIIIGAAAANRRFYHIKSNTASATTTTTLTLYHPVRYAIAGTEWATINPCPWADVRPMGSGATYDSACGMPLQPVTATYYAWMKTRGPIFGTVMSTVPGAAANDRLVVFHQDGSMKMADEAWNAGTSEQICGWLMPRTASTYAAGDQGVYLQIE